MEDIRRWLVDGPLSLAPEQVSSIRDTALARLEQFVPSPVASATTALRLLGALVLVVFVVFFLLKDGDRMWTWVLSWTPRRHEARMAAAGEEAWATLRRYVAGTVLVAAIDAVGIGLALVLLGVPLWFSLALLTFLGAFVPVLGATVAGAAAVFVTLASEGPRDALILLGAVLLVQQLEGNVLQPLIMGRAVSLHPLVVLVAVTCGFLLLGILGALFAVPVVAVAYRVAARMRELPATADTAGET